MSGVNDAIITTGKNSSGSAAVDIEMKDEKGNTIDYVEVAASDSNNNYEAYSVYGTPGTDGSLTVYRSGKTVMLKAVNYVCKMGGPNYTAGTNGYYTAGNLLAKFRPSVNQHFYQKIIAYANTENANLNGLDAYFVSFIIQSNGDFGTKLNKKNYAGNTTWTLNFDLVWLVE